MDKKEFKIFCKNEFVARGFKKVKKLYYLRGKDLLCGIELAKSNYGNIYYVDFFFCIGNYDGVSDQDLPTYHESDIQGRIPAMSKTQTVNGRHVLTAMIEYEEYSEDELRPFFEQSFNERILPPVYQGKKFILDNLGTKYTLIFDKEEVLRKLQS